MKKNLMGASIAVFLLPGLAFSQSPKTDSTAMTRLEAMAEKIAWIEQGAVRIQTGGKTLYIDPYVLKKDDRADIVLITHAHDDHLSPPDLARIVAAHTLFIAPADCAATIQEVSGRQTITLEPGMTLKTGEIQVEAVPAYNIATEYHPKANRWVGYILTIEGIRIYHAGDTGLIPEMKNVKCDIALLPLHRPYGFDKFEDTVQAALDCTARIVIPIHYGYNCGDPQDAVRLKEALTGKCRVIIKERTR